MPKQLIKRFENNEINIYSPEGLVANFKTTWAFHKFCEGLARDKDYELFDDDLEVYLIADMSKM